MHVHTGHGIDMIDPVSTGAFEYRRIAGLAMRV
jgi:hypothetical protein